MTATMEAWRLADVQVGDRLVAKAFGRHATYTVEKLTATLAVCERGIRFNRETGHLVGEQTFGWGRTYAHKYGPADALAERLEKAREGLRNLVVTAENIERVEAALIPKSGN